MSDKIKNEVRSPKNEVRSIRFESDDWKVLTKLAKKYDLATAHLVRKAVKKYIKGHY